MLETAQYEPGDIIQVEDPFYSAIKDEIKYGLFLIGPGDKLYVIDFLDANGNTNQGWVERQRFWAWNNEQLFSWSRSYITNNATRIWLISEGNKEGMK